MSIGENIRRARKKAGLSQEELAERMYMSRGMIMKFETERSIPSMATGRELAKVLGVPVQELYE